MPLPIFNQQAQPCQPTKVLDCHDMRWACCRWSIWDRLTRQPKPMSLQAYSQNTQYPGYQDVREAGVTWPEEAPLGPRAERARAARCTQPCFSSLLSRPHSWPTSCRCTQTQLVSIVGRHAVVAVIVNNSTHQEAVGRPKTAQINVNLWRLQSWRQCG
jgi:hypothetical protein